jgi:arginase
MQVVMIGAPLALGQAHEGVELAPAALRAAGIAQAVRGLGHEWADHGDLPLPSRRTIELANTVIATAHTPAGRGAALRYSAEVSQACAQIAAATEAVARQGPGTFVLTVGGDHAMALGSVTGIHRARPDMALIWVDSHGDFNTPETSFTGNLHGMPVAALVGYRQGLPGFDWLAAGGPPLAPARVALVGVRSLDAGERTLLKEANVAVFTMKEIDRYGIARVMEQVLETVDPDHTRPIHVSYDIDVVDPSEAPGTGTRVKGGLTYRESHLVVELLAETGRLGSMDLVEINPALEADGGTRTVTLGLELVLSALGQTIM